MSGDGLQSAGNPVPVEILIRWEIWRSLVSMLRVYAHAASLNHGEFVVDTLSDAAWVRHKGNTLGLCFSPNSGSASWRLRATDGSEYYNSFQILGTGALEMDGREMQLDVAAIDWIEAVTRAGRSPEEEMKERAENPGLAELEAEWLLHNLANPSSPTGAPEDSGSGNGGDTTGGKGADPTRT